MELCVSNVKLNIIYTSQIKEGTLELKKIVAQSSVILSIILIILSICGISNVDCFKGYIPIQHIFVLDNMMMEEIAVGDVKASYKLIPLFYIAVVFIIISGILYFNKENKIKCSIVLVLSFVPGVYVFFRHNYLFFLMFVNIYLMLYIFLELYNHNEMKKYIFILTTSVIIVLTNIIMLIKHIRLNFVSIEYEIYLVRISRINLICLTLWLIPYGILLVKEIKTRKTEV